MIKGLVISGYIILATIVGIMDIFIATAAVFSTLILFAGLASIPILYAIKTTNQKEKIINKTNFFKFTLILFLSVNLIGYSHEQLVIKKANSLIQENKNKTGVFFEEKLNGYRIKMIKPHDEDFVYVELFNFRKKDYKNGKWEKARFSPFF